jgi:aminomethyltransferase
MAVEGGGEVTSGSLSPMLEAGIGLGYLPAARSAPGTALTLDVRGRPRRGEVRAKPLYRRPAGGDEG